MAVTSITVNGAGKEYPKPGRDGLETISKPIVYYSPTTSNYGLFFRFTGGHSRLNDSDYLIHYGIMGHSLANSTHFTPPDPVD
jgi:hypothetical protein